MLVKGATDNNRLLTPPAAHNRHKAPFGGRTCRDACRDRLPTVAGKTFPPFPAHVQPAILSFWQETHVIDSMLVYLIVLGKKGAPSEFVVSMLKGIENHLFNAGKLSKRYRGASIGFLVAVHIAFTNDTMATKFAAPFYITLIPKWVKCRF